MTKKQKEFKKRLIKSVHISKKYQEYYKYDKESYEALLEDRFGVKSSKDMDIDQLILLVDFLNDKRNDLPSMRRKSSASPAQLKAIKSLWGEKADNPSEKALREFIYRITKRYYLHIDAISKGDAQKMIIVLKKFKGSKCV